MVTVPVRRSRSSRSPARAGWSAAGRGDAVAAARGHVSESEFGYVTESVTVALTWQARFGGGARAPSLRMGRTQSVEVSSFNWRVQRLDSVFLMV